MDDDRALKDFRSRFDESKTADSKRHALIQDLIDQNDKLVRDNKQMADDLESEKDGRRRLQDRIREELEPLKNRRCFVLVLIDADGDDYIASGIKFRAEFLNKNEEGGRRAADELLVSVRQYLKQLEMDVENTDIVVRAYANLQGLGKHCVRDGLIKTTADLGLFANGFTKRQPLFDFVDVGLGKERADDKLRETFNFFINNGQCKHILFGVAHDSGYAAFLERFAANDSIRDRITLLEGSQASPVIRGLGFKRSVQFTSVFGSRPVSKGQGSLLQPQPTVTKQANHAAKGPYSSNAVDRDRLGPVFKNGDGKRMDKPLFVNTILVQALKKKNLCCWLFLRGHCDGCKRSHAHQPLRPEEQDALWVVAREGICFTHRHGKMCDDPLCVYGHAPWSDESVPAPAVEDAHNKFSR